MPHLKYGRFAGNETPCDIDVSCRYRLREPETMTRAGLSLSSLQTVDTIRLISQVVEPGTLWALSVRVRDAHAGDWSLASRCCEV
jgi:hypothetical protein